MLLRKGIIWFLLLTLDAINIIMTSTETELKKEFELERMILFSDAVFAIAITLLIIEVKFPEVSKGASPADVFHEFKPVIIRFLAFILTFFFTGLMWARHLRVFKYLKTYDNGLIARNLVMLFFIVCFPFSASGITEHIRPGFFIPVYIYLFNLTFVAISNYFICLYIFKTKKQLLTIPGFEVEKNYIFLQSKFSAIILSVTLVVVIMLSVFLRQYVIYGFYTAPVLMGIARRYLKKYKPVKL